MLSRVSFFALMWQQEDLTFHKLTGSCSLIHQMILKYDIILEYSFSII